MPISVCVATYNGEKYIAEQLQSVLGQLGPSDEIVLSDDGSTDNTLEHVQALHDPRIIIIKNQLGRGPVRNFENAIRHASGEIIFLCDQDDLWLPSKLELMCSSLRNHILAVSDCTLVDEELKVLTPSYFAKLDAGPGLLKNLKHNSYVGCCMAFRRELVEVILPFPPRLDMHDAWIGMMAELYGQVTFIPEPLIFFRRHGNNASTTGGRSTRSLKAKIFARVYLMTHLLIRYVSHLPHAAK